MIITSRPESAQDSSSVNEHHFPCPDFIAFGNISPDSDGSLRSVSFYAEMIVPRYLFVRTFTNDEIRLEPTDKPELVIVHYSVRRVNGTEELTPYVTHISPDISTTYYPNTTLWTPDYK